MWEARKRIERGWIASGKFDLLHNQIIALEKTNAQSYLDLKQAIHVAIGSKQRVHYDLIPNLAILFGESITAVYPLLLGGSP